MKRNNVDNVILSGGEPLLHPHFYFLIDYLKNSGFELDVCSNGMLINDEAVCKLKDRLSEITISIDGYEQTRHDGMRQVTGSFEIVREAILRLVKADIVVHTTTVVDPPFAGEINRMVRFLYEMGVRSASFIGLIPIELGFNRLFEPNVQELLERQFEHARNEYADMEINTKELLVSKSKGKCEAGHIVFGMGVDGSVLHPCLLLRKRDGKSSGSNTAGLCPGSRYLTQQRKETKQA